MGNKSKFYIRGLFLSIFTTFILCDYFAHTRYISFIFHYKIGGFITPMELFYLFLIFEMLQVIIPHFNNHSYNGKHLLKHFEKVETFNKQRLTEFSKDNNRRVIRSALFWVIFNLPFVYLGIIGILPSLFFFYLFFAYYFFDTICVNFFCIFHLWITRNKCCNECRIYNWSYIMYCTPFFFILNPWTIILIGLSFIILIQWEYSAFVHPERFSSISNKTLQCKTCSYNCRYYKKTQ